MQTLFNIDQDGSLIISEYGFDPDGYPTELRVPAEEHAVLRAILNAPTLASGQSSIKAAHFNDLSIVIDDDDGSVILEQTRVRGMGGTDSRIEITRPQLWPAISELARLAQLSSARGTFAGEVSKTHPRD